MASGFNWGEHVPKADLVDGAYYLGTCRNARVARWCAKGELFYYWRDKLGCVYVEAIRCPEDFGGFDVFVPWVETREEFEVPLDEKRGVLDRSRHQEYYAWAERTYDFWSKVGEERRRNRG